MAGRPALCVSGIPDRKRPPAATLVPENPLLNISKFSRCRPAKGDARQAAIGGLLGLRKLSLASDAKGAKLRLENDDRAAINLLSFGWRGLQSKLVHADFVAIGFTRDGICRAALREVLHGH
jgi:hypothetical protein